MENIDPHQKLAYELTIAFLKNHKGLETPELFFKKYDEVYPEFYSLVSNRYGMPSDKKPLRRDI